MGATVRGIYFPGGYDGNEVVKRLADIAEEFGLVVETGSNVGQGSPGKLLIAIASGELAVVHPTNAKEGIGSRFADKFRDNVREIRLDADESPAARKPRIRVREPEE